MTFWLQYLERRCSDNIPRCFKQKLEVVLITTLIFTTSAILYADQKKILPLYHAKKRILTKSCSMDYKVSFDIRNSSSFFQ